MKGKLIAMLAAAVLLTAVFAFVYGGTRSVAALSAAITFGTIAYHFIMRFAVGGAVDLIMRNRADYESPWFREKPWEPPLYRRLGVRKWKNAAPTYKAELFDISKRSLTEVAQATCQAEVVHEIIVILSFVPLLFAIPFGELPVFAVTSVLAACLDLVFVIMQRYNRPRIVKLIKRRERQ